MTLRRPSKQKFSPLAPQRQLGLCKGKEDQQTWPLLPRHPQTGKHPLELGVGDKDMKSLALVPSILLIRTVKTQSVILDILIERKAYIDFSRKQYVYTSV